MSSTTARIASLDSPDEVFTVGINRAVTLLAERKARGPSRHGPQALKELGKNEAGDIIKVMKGRYGPYVTDGKINATIMSDTDPMSLTLEDAQTLIAARAAKGPSKKQKKKRRRRKPLMPRRRKSLPRKRKPHLLRKRTNPSAKSTRRDKC